MSYEFLNVSGNKIFLTLNVLYLSGILRNYKKRKHVKGVTKTLVSNRNVYHFLFNKVNSFLRTNILFLRFNVLNHQVKKDEVNYFLNELKNHVSVVFPRKTSLFFDFLKLTVLYRKSLITLETYANVLAEIFAGVHKKSQGKFMIFLEDLFKLFYNDSESLFAKDYSAFSGIRVIASGRLRGKAKASTEAVNIGIIPSQSIVNNIDYAKSRSYISNLGVIGLKIWTYKE